MPPPRAPRAQGSDGALRPVCGPGYLVSSRVARTIAVPPPTLFPVEADRIHLRRDNAGLKGVPISRYERGLVPRSYREALCVVCTHRARNGPGNGAKPRLAMPILFIVFILQL